MTIEATKEEVVDPAALLSGPREEIVRHQDEQIARLTSRAWDEVGFYRELWTSRHGADAPRPEAFEEWPLWNVAELREAMNQYPPFGNLYTQEGLDDIRFIHSSSGTTGKPRYAPFTGIDAPCVARAYGRIAGLLGDVTAEDVFCVTGSYGLPIGAWSYTRMAQSVGATIVPAGSGRLTPSDKLIDIITDLGVTVVHGAPSYLLHIGRKAQETGRSLAGSGVRLLWLGGEAAPTETRKELEKSWGAQTTTLYANSDLGWIAGECWASSQTDGAEGMHLLEDYVRVEVLDENGRACADGELGELVITSWLRPSTPRVRFRTGDRGAIDTSPCRCGLTSARLLPLAGRTDDAIRFHGITIWPQAVEDVLSDLTGRRHEFVIERKARPDGVGDLLRVAVESLADEPAPLDAPRIAEGLRARLSVSFEVDIVGPGETAEATGLGTRPKVRRFVDLTQQ